MGFTNIFGGNVVKPAQQSYLALSISTNTSLVWPVETIEGAAYLAGEIDVTATASGLALALPNAQNGATGVSTIITNVGTNSINLTDSTGNTVVSLTSSVSWLLSLTNNSTAAGVWRLIQIGAAPSAPQAYALAGAGLQANNLVLQSNLPTSVVSTSSSITAAARATLVDWTGAAGGTLALDTVANLGAGWWTVVMNNGAGTITITSPQNINGLASLSLPVNSAVTLVATSSGIVTASSVAQAAGNPFYTSTTPISLTGSAMTLTSLQTQALSLKFTGTLSANYVVTFPAATPGMWFFNNQTSGAYTLTLTISGGTSYILAQGYDVLLVSDGTSWYLPTVDPKSIQQLSQLHAVPYLF